MVKYHFSSQQFLGDVAYKVKPMCTCRSIYTIIHYIGELYFNSTNKSCLSQNMCVCASFHMRKVYLRVECLTTTGIETTF